jgi:hypothetical protein
MILAVPSQQYVADSIGPCNILSILSALIACASCNDLLPILMAAPSRHPAPLILWMPHCEPLAVIGRRFVRLCHRAYPYGRPNLLAWGRQLIVNKQNAKKNSFFRWKSVEMPYLCHLLVDFQKPGTNLIVLSRLTQWGSFLSPYELL